MSRAATTTTSNTEHGALRAWAQQYSVETEPLGRGSFASVYKGVNRYTKEPVAVKVMTKARLGERALNMLSAEINILRTLRHPNVVCLRDSHTTERRILIVLEYCGGGDLGQFIQTRGPSPEPTARHFMLQLVAGLTFLRSRHLIHRDIKPQNLLLSEDSSRACLKIADFGLARHLPQGSLAESMLGSPLYMAPEILSNRAYDAKADLWSAGAVLFEILTAKHPYGGTNQVELMNNIRRNRPRLPPGVTLSPPCVELLGMLLVPQPDQRASLQKFVSCAFLNNGSSPPPAALTASPNGGGGTAGENNCEGGGGGRDGEPRAVSPRPGRSAAKSTEPAADALRQRGQRVPPAEAHFAMYRTTVTVTTPEREREMDVATTGGSSGSRSVPFLQHGYKQQQQQRQQQLPQQRQQQWSPDSVRRMNRSDAAREGQPLDRTSDDGPAPSDAAAASNGAGRPAGGGGDAGAQAEDVRPTGNGDGNGNGDDGGARNDGIVGHPVGGRNGERGWDWGDGRGLTPALAVVAAAEAGGVHDGGAVTDGVNDGGPLPALPALPFARGPFGIRGSFKEDGCCGGDGNSIGGDDGDCPQGSAGFAFDLAFAGSPMRSRCRVVPATAAPSGGGGSERDRHSYSASDAAVGPERREREGFAAALTAVVPLQRPQAESHAGDAVSLPRVPAAFPPATPARPRSHSVSDGASLRTKVEHSEQQIECNTAAGVSTAPSPAFHTSGDHDSGYPAAAGGADGIAGGIQGGGEGGRGYAQISSCSSSSSSPSPSHSPSPPAVDLGVPVLLKPSFRGSDSLLTIPEDSTGFVLVTRPSSITCEHGQNCECWAWSGGPGVASGGAGAGAGAGIMRSPSTSYLAAAANPYGGPGKASTGPGVADTGGLRRSGASAFLGLGNIWNTAINTFRGVAGAHGRRSSWPAARGRHQQTRGSMGSGSPPTAAASPAHSRAGSCSPREQHRSPHSSVPYRHFVSAAESSGGSGQVGRSTNSSGESNSGGGGGGSRRDSCFSRQRGDCGGSGGTKAAANHATTSTAYRGSVGSFQQQPAAPPPPPPPQPQPQPQLQPQLHLQPQLQPQPWQQPHQYQHQRRHSEPLRPKLYNNNLEGLIEGGGIAGYNQGRGYSSSGGSGGSGGYSSRSMNGGFTNPRSATELVEAQRVKAAADRAEVVGKRAILLVTLADKTAQEAMALALESPARAVAAAAAARGEGAGEAMAAVTTLQQRRRHELLTEALSLYIKALALLQGALPGVLFECEGAAAPADAFPALNALSAEISGQQLPRPLHQQSQHQFQQQMYGRSSPSVSPSLLAERSALVTKASWLKELFSKTLQRAEHCRAQISSAAVGAAAVAAAAAAAAEAPAQHSAAGDFPPSHGKCPSPAEGVYYATEAGENDTVAAFGGADAGSAGGGGNPAAAAVYRSAIEHGQEAAVCYLLGRSDTAITHYVRACALLQLLAFEPEMAGPGVEEMFYSEQQQQQQQQQLQSSSSGGWRAHVLAMADAYAQQVEVIGRGDGR